MTDNLHFNQIDIVSDIPAPVSRVCRWFWAIQWSALWHNWPAWVWLWSNRRHIVADQLASRLA